MLTCRFNGVDVDMERLSNCQSEWIRLPFNGAASGVQAEKQLNWMAHNKNAKVLLNSVAGGPSLD